MTQKAQKGVLDKRPIASILIPAYNAEKFISDAVESARRQTLSNIEIIICNDGSSDRTEAIIREIARADPRIKIIRNPSNFGISLTRNIALQHACGRWLFFLDADDLLHPQQLEILVALGEHYQADVVINNLYWISADGKKYVGPAVHDIKETQPLSSTIFINRSSRMGFSWGYLRPLVKMEFIRQHNISIDNRLITGIDFYFLCAIFIAGARSIFSPMPMYYYRLHPQSITALPANRRQRAFDQLINGTQILLELTKYYGNTEADAALYNRLEFLTQMRDFASIIDSLKNLNTVSALKGMIRLKSRFLHFFFRRAWEELAWRLRWKFAKSFKLEH